MNESDKRQVERTFNELNYERCRFFSIVVGLLGLGLVIVDPFISDLDNPLHFGLHICHWYVFVVSLLGALYLFIFKHKHRGNMIAIILASAILLYNITISAVFDTQLDRGIIAYLFTILAVGAVLYFRYYVSGIIVGLSLATFVTLLLIFQDDKDQLIGDMINGSSFTVVSFFFFITTRKRKQKEIEQGIIINNQKEKLEETNEEITNQRDLIQEQNNETMDSIECARSIQNALIIKEKEFRSHFDDSYIIYKPKQIVSGDFYWLSKVNGHLIFAVADCTGHGVPGALMSMLGISFLNEIVRRKEVTKASEVLNQLRNAVIESLNQSGKLGDNNEGMDIAICVIHLENLMCQYAGANNPVYLIKDNSDNIDLTPEIIELKPDKQPVAIHIKMHPFSDKAIQLQKGDKLYLFSDGFADQFGGEHGKKFKYSPFKEAILANSDKPFNKQKEILEDSLYEWMNYGDRILEQIDDITVIGLKIPDRRQAGNLGEQPVAV